jgi:hypothetical protein
MGERRTSDPRDGEDTLRLMREDRDYLLSEYLRLKSALEVKVRKTGCSEVEFECGHTVAHEESCPRCEAERLRVALEEALVELLEMNKGIGWRDGEWPVVAKIKKAIRRQDETSAGPSESAQYRRLGSPAPDNRVEGGRICLICHQFWPDTEALCPGCFLGLKL